MVVCVALNLAMGCADDAGSDGDSTPKDAFDVPVEPVVMASAPRFSPPGGGFRSQQLVSLAAPDGAGSLYFTLDGSLPTPSSPPYSEPIAIEQTTLVRALWIDETTGEQLYGAQTYVALEFAAADFSSNLPIVLIERHGAEPIDTDSREYRSSSALFFEPGDDGRTRMDGPATLCTRSGVKVRGESSRYFAQKGLSLELWEAAEDDDYHVPVLGMPTESDWALLAPSQMDRSLMRTMLPMDLSRSIGVYAPRTRFVEVFLVDRRGSNSVSLDDYIGVYTFTEKIKRDEQRVNVPKLDDGDITEPAISGGYILRIDHDVSDFNSHGYGFQWEYPHAEDMRQPQRSAQRDYLVGYLDEFFEAISSDDFTHPITGRHYAELIDRARWIDHNLLVALTKNVDGLRLSAYFYKERNGPFVAGPIWDFDRSMGTPYDDRAVEPEEWARGDGTRPLTQMFWGDLFRDPEFERAYWERWDQLVDGPYSVSALTDRINSYEETLREARERHFERWPEYPPDGGPEGEVQILRDWFQRRVEWISEQRPR